MVTDQEIIDNQNENTQKILECIEALKTNCNNRITELEKEIAAAEQFLKETPSQIQVGSMFETEAGFAETKMLINCNGDYSKKQDYKKGWQDGATFGYNKCAKETEEEIVALKKDKEDLIFIRNQKAKCMCEDKQRLTKAKSIIKQFLNDYPVITKEVLDKLEQFVNEEKDIREDSTLDGDWVVDDH